VLIGDAHRLPVSTVLFLLRPAADGPELTGELQGTHHINGRSWSFVDQVIRVWQLASEQILGGGLGTLPLAMLCDDAAANPEPVIERLHERLDGLPDRPLAAELWTATGILMGLRYDRDVTQRLLRGVLAMKESVVYQEILEQGVDQGLRQGRIAEARDLLIAVASERFGAADVATLARVNAIDDRQLLAQLVKRSLHVGSWDELLGERPSS
jgi:predicted transposase YdaD